MPEKTLRPEIRGKIAMPEKILRPEIRGKSAKMLERLAQITMLSSTEIVNDAIEFYYKKLRDEDFLQAGKAQSELFKQEPQVATELLSIQGLSE